MDSPKQKHKPPGLSHRGDLSWLQRRRSRRLVPMPHEDGYIRSHTGREEHFHSLICDTGTSTRPTEASSVRPRSREFSGRKHGKLMEMLIAVTMVISHYSPEKNMRKLILYHLRLSHPQPSSYGGRQGKALSSSDMLMAMVDRNYDCTLVH